MTKVSARRAAKALAAQVAASPQAYSLPAFDRRLLSWGLAFAAKLADHDPELVLRLYLTLNESDPQGVGGATRS